MLTQKKKQMVRNRTLNSGVAIEERDEEDDAYRSNSPESRLKALSALGMKGRISSQALTLLKAELDGTSSLEGAISYTQLECNYLLSVLKNPSVQDFNKTGRKNSDQFC